MDTNQFERAWAEAVARTWKEGNQEFRKQLLTDPKAVFAKLGAPIPAGIDVVVIENTAGKLHFVLPPKPAELSEISDSKLTELYRACPGTVCATAKT
jgi:hypothetical protein